MRQSNLLGVALAVSISGVFAGNMASPTWLPGHLLPVFPPPAAELVVLDIWRADDRTVVLATSLQGIVNCREPTIWLLHERWRVDRKWLEDYADLYGVSWRSAGSVVELLGEFRERIKGAVVYDPEFPHSLNYACTLAAPMGCVVAHPRDVEMLGGLDIPVRRDLRDEQWGSAAAMYLEAWLRCGRSCENRILAGQPLEDRDRPEDHQTISAYARAYHMALRGFAFDLNPYASVEDQRTVDQIAAASICLAPFQSFVLGGEAATLTYCSARDLMAICGYPGNATVLSARPPRQPRLPARTVDLRLITQPDKVFVNLVWSDGDNPRYCYTAMRYAIFEPRTQAPNVALTYTISPLLADLGPAMIHYYARNAGPRDSFMAGLSGVGYCYPWQFSEVAQVRFAEATRLYMDLAGLCTIQVMVRDGGSPGRWLEELVRVVRPLGVQALHSAIPSGRPFYFEGLPTPICTSRGGGWVDADGLRRLASAARDEAGPLFLTTGLNCWKGGELYGVLKERAIWEHVEFLTAEEFFAAQNPDFLENAWGQLRAQVGDGIPQAALQAAGEAAELTADADFEAACPRWREAIRTLIGAAGAAGVEVNSAVSVRQP